MTSHALISAIARLVTITAAMKEQIEVEGEKHMQSGIDLKAIAKLFHLENFILEVSHYRMYDVFLDSGCSFDSVLDCLSLLKIRQFML